MTNTHQTLRNTRQWKATTGLTKDQFYHLSEKFGEAYEDIFGKTLEVRQGNGTVESAFKTASDLLFFLLFSLKTGLGQDALGFIFGLDGSNVNRRKKLALRIMHVTLTKLGVMPKREFEDIEEFKAYFKEHKSLILDGTEQRIQRPSNQEEQKDFYSGKKNAIP